MGRTEALYAAVTEEGRVAEEEGSNLTAVRTRLEREKVQIGTAVTLWQLSLAFECDFGTAIAVHSNSMCCARVPSTEDAAMSLARGREHLP